MRSATQSIAALVLLVGCAVQRAPLDQPTQSCSSEPCAAELVPSRCPEDMVLVADSFCIDRYEATMVDAVSGQELSPFYPPSLPEMQRAVVGQAWGPAAVGKAKLDPPVPLLPEWQRASPVKARAVSRPGVTPQGYLSRLTAQAACLSANKRLCKLEEWKLACRGEEHTTFPYGPKYHQGACNVHLNAHPAFILHGDASIGHWDPRLNRVAVQGSTLLKPTGGTPTCKSTWGHDAVYDMVGNLDEWVEDGKGTFVGGFYSRDTVRGCEAKVTEHGAAYFDYSTGVRCCADLR